MSGSPRALAGREGHRWTAPEQAFLLETSHEFASSRDIQTVLERLSERILEVLPASRSGILLLEEDEEHVVLAAGRDRELLRGPTGSRRLLELRLYPEVQHVRRTRRPLAIADVANHPLMGPVLPQVAPTGLRSLLCVPLEAGERFLGVLSVGWFGEVRPFGDRETALCQTIANQAAVALENARLYEELRRLNRDLEVTVHRRTRRLERSLEQMAVINEIAHHLAGTLEPDHLAQKAVDRLREGFDLYAALIAFLDEDSGRFRMAAVSCAESDRARALRSLEQGLDEGICGYVAARGEPYLTGDTENDPHFLPTALEATRSELCVPLRMGGRVVGVLDVQADRRDAFDDDDRVALEALADTVGASVRTAELFAQAREARAFTEAVIENLTGGLLVMDRRGVVQRANLRACEILDVRREEIEGYSLLRQFPDARPMLEYDPGRPGREIIVRSGDGRMVPLGFSNAFFASREGGMEAVLISFQDLSEVKELQRRVQHRERLATIGEVASAVAHEVRNPLFGITSTAQTLSRRAGEGTPSRELLEGLLAEARRLDQLVADLLIYGRQASPRLRPGDLADLVREVARTQEGPAREGGIALETEAPDTLQARFDRDQVKGAVLNLLRNAQQAAVSRVRVRLLSRGAEAVLEVRDDGPGVPPEKREAIFGLYFTTKGGSGSGIGLALCRKVARDHGGDVACFEEAGEGALFVMRLALDPEAGVDGEEGG